MKPKDSRRAQPEFGYAPLNGCFDGGDPNVKLAQTILGLRLRLEFGVSYEVRF